MRKSLFTSMLAAVAAMGQAKFKPFQVSGFRGEPHRRKKANPAGSKLARQAIKRMVAVKHGGMRLDGVEGIRFRQIHK